MKHCHGELTSCPGQQHMRSKNPVSFTKMNWLEVIHISAGIRLCHAREIAASRRIQILAIPWASLLRSPPIGGRCIVDWNLGSMILINT
mmetsp:Transcript_31153/g.63782  ORF Transcript_31153/g.63782 Transcript_31153/m.63782 type:complete len:89 (-) Transcript_31153:411-677(-)